MTMEVTKVIGIATTLCLKENDTALACYNFDLHQLFGRNVAKKVRSQMVLYLSTSPN